MKIFDEIYKIGKSGGSSESEVAAKLGISQQLFSLYRKRKHVRIPIWTLLKIQKVFELSDKEMMNLLRLEYSDREIEERLKSYAPTRRHLRVRRKGYDKKGNLLKEKL